MLVCGCERIVCERAHTVSAHACVHPCVQTCTHVYAGGLAGGRGVAEKSEVSSFETCYLFDVGHPLLTASAHT